MRQFLSRFRPFFLYAGVFSLFINLLLLVPALYMLQVFDRVLLSRSDETLVVLTVGAVTALAIMMLLDVLRGRLLTSAGLALDRLLGPRVLSGLLSTARTPGAGEYVHGLRDVAALRGFLTGTGIFSLFDAPWLPVYLLVIYLFHPLLGIVATGGAGILLLLAFLNEKLTRRPLEELQAEQRRAGRFIDAGLRNAEVVNALGMTSAVTQRWQGINQAVLVRQADASRVGGGLSSATRFMRQLVQVLVLATGAWLVIDLHVTSGVMIAATILLGRALAPVETMIAGWKSMVDARSAYHRLEALLGRAEQEGPVTELPAPAGRLSAERVVFGIRGQERPILKGVSFQLDPGESLGIIGPSGSGKSTLARLIVGVWKPMAGSMRLDGAEVSAWPRERLGPYVGYLPQDVELFAGSVAENIARMGAVDSEAVVQAARRAQAHELVLRLPRGYDTEIGEAGAVLSGGQRQRIALARALYGQPRLLVLDEPNSNLDNEGEEALMRALAALKQEGTTLILITHRPSLLASIDKVLVLRDGTVENFGPRAEVIAKVTRGSIPPSTPAIVHRMEG
jgi:PrtD family type I secretion system ABC transporter